MNCKRKRICFCYWNNIFKFAITSCGRLKRSLFNF